MGGILLILSFISIYIVIYWSIYIEIKKNKSIGYLAFSAPNCGSLNIYSEDTTKYSSRSQPVTIEEIRDQKIESTITNQKISSKTDKKMPLKKKHKKGFLK